MLTWVKLSRLNQLGGSVMSIQRNDPLVDNYDCISYGLDIAN